MSDLLARAAALAQRGGYTPPPNSDVGKYIAKQSQNTSNRTYTQASPSPVTPSSHSRTQTPAKKTGLSPWQTPDALYNKAKPSSSPSPTAKRTSEPDNSSVLARTSANVREIASLMRDIPTVTTMNRLNKAKDLVKSPEVKKLLGEITPKTNPAGSTAVDSISKLVDKDKRSVSKDERYAFSGVTPETNRQSNIDFKQSYMQTHPYSIGSVHGTYGGHSNPNRSAAGSSAAPGIDMINANQRVGAPVWPTVGGNINDMGYNPASGWYVEVKDPQERLHSYKHLFGDPSDWLSMGQEVSPMEMIGRIGASGNSLGQFSSPSGFVDPSGRVNPGSGHHLHYDMRAPNSFGVHTYRDPTSLAQDYLR